MKKLLGIVVLGLMLCSNAYAGLIYGKETLPIVTKPEGANCSLKNNKGNWNVITPDKIKLKLSKKKLSVVCYKAGYKTKEQSISVQPKDSLLSKMADHNINGPDLDMIVTDGISAVISGNPLHALGEIIFTGVEAVAKVTGKAGTFIKEPVTYATHLIPNKNLYNYTEHYEVKKKLKDEGYVAFILIELEKE
jgi:hypothetical protein